MTDYSAAENFILKKLESELPKDLTYHGVHHMFDVLNAAMEIAAKERITNEEDLKLLRIAVLFHDAGFIHIYKGHEEKGCEMAKEFLPQFGFNEEQLDKICGMIAATKLPQEPHTHLECIIADADLDYLGRDDFYPIAKTLFDEWKVYLNITDEKEWNRIQSHFLFHHHYHTAYCVKMREPEKQKRLREIKKLVSSQS
jgi:predicted metal-dependent HD superfamily phosphohydrolase